MRPIKYNKIKIGTYCLDNIYRNQTIYSNTQVRTRTRGALPTFEGRVNGGAANKLFNFNSIVQASRWNLNVSDNSRTECFRWTFRCLYVCVSQRCASVSFPCIRIRFTATPERKTLFHHFVSDSIRFLLVYGIAGSVAIIFTPNCLDLNKSVNYWNVRFGARGIYALITFDWSWFPSIYINIIYGVPAHLQSPFPEATTRRWGQTWPAGASAHSVVPKESRPFQFFVWFRKGFAVIWAKSSCFVLGPQAISAI